ncbi:unnamed protein product [Periconia digitata]|uniref:Sulfatase N-terminal domain-containing protein n=1 Tax=Periconia digitata TaxID=1303443 RepID=A0A9W4USG9_9PLEO|nr:unnamed protein product [Periconia digitata]
MIDDDDPFFLFLSPTAPHADDETQITVPCQRHMDLFPNITAPRLPNFNPSDEAQSHIGGWIKSIPFMSEGNITWADSEYRRRIQALQGIDEMLADLLKKLEENKVLDNTYVVFSSDNGYHLGNHRMTAGKATAFIEDTNLPFVVRGPGIQAESKTSIPSSFIDIAPTLLDIAGVSEADRPSFLDGRSVLPQWKDPNAELPGAGDGNNFEVLNIEYWGSNGVFIPNVELYNTIDDPYELNNLARDPNAETTKLLNRLNAMLLVQKSCSTDVCQNPWMVLLANSTLPAVSTLKQSMHSMYDEHFASFPKVNIARCLGFQSTANEAPFWPPGAKEYLYENKNSTEALGPSRKFTPTVPENETPQGTEEQRHVTIDEIMQSTRELTADELNKDQEYVTRSSGRGS